MKANELMIGDWVNTPNGISRVIYIAKYSGIYTDNTNIGEKLYSPYEINPIPLTPEILEENGWKNISDHTLKGCETFRLHLEQRSFDYTLTLKMRDYFRLDSHDDRVYTLCEVNFGFNYVHKLQHALRLCGIEKEIEL